MHRSVSLMVQFVDYYRYRCSVAAIIITHLQCGLKYIFNRVIDRLRRNTRYPHRIHPGPFIANSLERDVTDVINT